MTPPAVAFFDTSVLVYAHDASAPGKRDIARGLILDHLGAGTLRTSTQALTEYFSVVTSKGEVPLSAKAAAWLIEQLPADCVVAPGYQTTRAAVRLCASAGVSIWDALIVETAREAAAEVLYTEDGRLLRTVNGEPSGLRALDPFADA
jgi:predicted nucleic acid-binding protein